MPAALKTNPRPNPADRAVRFFENLTLTDDFDGQPFRLRDWQKDRIIRPIFGTLRPDGRRQYRRVFLFLPRKQAKTQICAGIGMYGLKGTGRAGEEIICAASDISQASHIFKKCSRMIEADPWLSRTTRVYRSARRIECRETDNALQVVSSDGRRQHGLNPSILLFDELHTQPNRELYDALTSGFQTREEPLTILISTAGNEFESLCYEEYEFAKRVEENPSIDPTYLPIIYEADEEDDIFDERTWFKAMPALGDFASLEFIRSEFARAKETPSEEVKCRQFYLNLWTPAAVKWLPAEAWKACGEFDVDYATDFDRVPVYAGLDMSNNADTTAFVWTSIHDGVYKVGCKFWIPEDAAKKLDRTAGTQFAMWARQGYVTIIPGHYIDYDAVFKWVLNACEVMDVREIRADPFSAQQIVGKLRAEHVNAVFMRQGAMSMNEPLNYLEVLLDKRRIHHGNNPILTMMARNAVLKVDIHGNKKVDKKKTTGKIDGLISLIMAVGAGMMDPGEIEGGVSLA